MSELVAFEKQQTAWANTKIWKLIDSSFVLHQSTDSNFKQALIEMTKLMDPESTQQASKLTEDFMSTFASSETELFEKLRSEFNPIDAEQIERDKKEALKFVKSWGSLINKTKFPNDELKA